MPIEVEATTEVTVKTETPQIVIVEISAAMELPIFTSTPQFVTYEIGRN